MKNTLEKYVIDYQGCKSNPKKTLCMLFKYMTKIYILLIVM